MRITFPSGNLNWMQVFDDLGSLPSPPGPGDGSVAIIKDDGSGNYSGMLWNGTSWVQAFGPAIVDSVINNLRKHNFSAVSDPSVNDDVDLGYEVGSRWVNLVSNSHFVCVDSTDGVAVWLRTDNVAGSGTALEQKAGIILAATFALSGGHMQATVTFGTAFADASYSIAVEVQSSGATGRRYTTAVVSKAAAAFSISLGSNVKTDLVAVSWVATKVGEN